MSRVVDALLSVIETMVDNPASILILLGIVAILMGWAYSEIWIVAIGLLTAIVGIIASVGKRR
jgi:hypothetical protein